MPPEYLSQGQVSLKSDVYSFGVLVLEIVSGQNINTFKIGENSENLLAFVSVILSSNYFTNRSFFN